MFLPKKKIICFNHDGAVVFPYLGYSFNQENKNQEKSVKVHSICPVGNL